MIGNADAVKSMTADDLRAFHKQHFGPNVITVAAVGGFSDLNKLADEIDQRFGDWATVEKPADLPNVPAPDSDGRRATTEIPGKSQADLAVGWLSLPRSHPDYYAFEIVNLILGRLGLMGRLGANVRDKQGLAYYAYSTIDLVAR